MQTYMHFSTWVFPYRLQWSNVTMPCVTTCIYYLSCLPVQVVRSVASNNCYWYLMNFIIQHLWQHCLKMNYYPQVHKM
jgi:hypothetical protein